MATTTETQDQRRVVDLLKDLRDETTFLVRQEVALAKTEFSEKAGQVGKNSTKLAVGGVLTNAGLIFILLGLSFLLFFGLVEAGLSEQLSFWLAPLIVGLVVALIGYIAMQNGINALKRQSVVPEETVASLKEDRQWVQHRTKKT